MVQKKRGTARKNSRLLPHPNVWVVLSVALLVIGLSVITALGPSSVTGNTVQSIGRMNKGDPLQLGVRDIPGLETVFTHADELITSGQISVEADDSILFDRVYVTKFKVSSENKFGPLTFNFRVKEQDLLDKGISRADLKLYHGREEYPLQLLKTDHGYLYYIVTVPSMGSFVLGRVETAEKTEPVVAEEKSAETAQPSVEEKPASMEEPVAQEPLVGEAAAQPAAEPQPGFFSRIAAFFRNLFS